jgi:hypothetical protein
MWRRRILRSAVVLGSASALMVACSSNAPVDINFGKEAGTGFDAPAREAGTGGATGAGGSDGVGGQGVGGAGGGGGDDAGVDAASGGAGGTASLIHQYQHPNRPLRAGAA